MPDFLYKARDQEGTLVQGTMIADSKEEIVEILQRRGLLITSVEEIIVRKKILKQALNLNQGIALSRRVKNDDLCVFSRQLGTLLNAGVPLLRALSVLGKQLTSLPLRNAVEAIKNDIQGGSTLKDALDRHPRVFSKFWVNLVGTGEASGQLPSVLEQIAEYFESSGELQRKVVSAMIYPIVLMTVSLSAVLAFVLKIVPVFAEMFKGFGGELPAVTQFLITLSDILRKYGLMVLIIGGVAGFLIKKFFSTEQGRLLFDQFRLRLPLFGTLFRNIAITNFARGLGTMISSGVPILYAFEIVTRTVGNRVMENALEVVKESVRDGKTIAEPLEQTGLFPPMVILMVNVGEETGELSGMLKHVADYFEDRVSVVVERLSTLIEPFMLVFMGGLVGFLVIAMFLPIFKLATTLK